RRAADWASRGSASTGRPRTRRRQSGPDQAGVSRTAALIEGRLAKRFVSAGVLTAIFPQRRSGGGGTPRGATTEHPMASLRKEAAAFVMEGGCTCRAVRYRLQRRPLFVHGCHCSWCQRETGTAFAQNALIEAGQVEVLSGAPELINTPSASG